MKVEVVGSSALSVSVYQMTWCLIQGVPVSCSWQLVVRVSAEIWVQS